MSCLLQVSEGFAQSSVIIKANPDHLLEPFPSVSFEDSVAMQAYFTNEISKIRAQGYLLANIDSIIGNFPNTKIVLHIGEKYELTTLAFENIPADIRQRLKNKPSKYLEDTYEAGDVDKMLKEIISYSENHGYPFANVQIDSIQVTGNSLHAKLIFDAGPMITFDSVYLSTPISKPSFLSAYLGATPGKPYDERIIKQIPERLSMLPFLSLEEPPKITFSNEASQVNLSVKRKVANRFDGYIGFFPNAKDGNKLLVTGKIDLMLTNLFSSGKSLKLFWEKQQIETQLFDVKYVHPNLFRGPLGLAFGLDLYKQDSSFINRKIHVGLSYLTGGYSNVQLFSRWESSRTTASEIQPGIADINLNNFGIQYERNSKGFTAFNRSDYEASIVAAIGKKELVNQQNEDSLVQQLDPQTVQYTYTVHLAGQQYLAPSFFLYAKLDAGLMVNDQLFLNDLFRLGGLKTIRGFYENEFYASEYITGTIEGRYYFDERSNLVAFFDVGGTSYALPGDSYQDTPFGFGIGTNIFTSAGTLSLNYALGKSNTQPLDFKFAKIHIGYVASF